MTALKEYERLECTGLWKETSDSQRREVLVSFGENSLILRDTTETALSHWSLPAIQRINEEKLPAVYKPGPDALETLEIDDETMIEAIGKSSKAKALKEFKALKTKQSETDARVNRDTVILKIVR